VRITAAIVTLERATLDGIKAQAVEKHLDFYKAVAAHVLGIEHDAVSKEDRNEAKQALFTYLYGGSKLGTRLGGS
jgi:DNA polymerase I-like protein with 3'-5' exonuclease and polymerase domains